MGVSSARHIYLRERIIEEYAAFSRSFTRIAAPASRVAGMLAYLEAIAGQMYVAILVARLVGMKISQNNR